MYFAACGKSEYEESEYRAVCVSRNFEYKVYDAVVAETVEDENHCRHDGGHNNMGAFAQAFESFFVTAVGTQNVERAVNADPAAE